MLPHIGTNVVKVFDDGIEEKTKEQLSNLSGTPWDPKQKEQPKR